MNNTKLLYHLYYYRFYLSIKSLSSIRIIGVGHIVVIGWLFLLQYQEGFSQQSTIEIRENQTSHLIFTSDIIYTDIGDQQHFIVDYTNNILRVKGLQNDQPTNLTVITKDDSYYSFYVRYSKYPKLNYFIDDTQRITRLPSTQQSKEEISLIVKSPEFSPKEVVVSQTQSTTLSSIAPTNSQADNQPLYQQAVNLLSKQPHFEYINARHGAIILKVTGIYHNLQHCFIHYQIRNQGIIPYDINYIEFGKKDKKRPNKSAINETLLPPIFIASQQLTQVAPKRTNNYVAVFDKMAIPEGKILYMEVVENGRNIHLVIPYNKLPIQQLKNNL